MKKYFCISTFFLAFCVNQVLCQCPSANLAGKNQLKCSLQDPVQIGSSPQANIKYSWTPTSGLSNPNISNPLANPSATTTYTLTASSPNLIQNGSFEQGNINFTAPDLTFRANIPVTQSAPYAYYICPNAQTFNSQWCNVANRTPGGVNMMAIDGGRNISANIFWRQSVAVIPNKNYLFSVWFLSLNTWLNNLTAKPRIQIVVNGVSIINTFDLPGNNCGWVNLQLVVNPGALNTALIEMHNLNTEEYGNDFAVDDVSLTCTSVSTTTVTVNPTPVISPKGPIDYYRGWEWAAAYGSYFLTANSISGNQWYIDNNPISASLGGTAGEMYPNMISSILDYPANPNYHYFSVSANGCRSNPVPFRFISYFNGNTDAYNGFTKQLPANTPGSYCQNSTGLFRMLDLGPSATYTWNLGFNYATPDNPITKIAGAPDYKSQKVSISPGSAGKNPYILNIADLNGRQIVMDYAVGVTPVDEGTGNGGCSNIEVYIDDYDFPNYLKPGSSKFDWEDYEFPSTMTLLNYTTSGYVVSTNPLKLHIPGRSPLPDPIRLRFTASTGYVKMNFYYSPDINGECYSYVRNYSNVNVGCKTFATPKTTEVNNDQIQVSPNPSSGNFTVSSKNGIRKVEVFSVYGNLVKSINLNIKVTNFYIGDLLSGTYVFKVTDVDRQVSFKKIVLVK